MKYSPELVDEIIKYIEEGSSDKDAAALAGISRETFYQWQRPFLDGLDASDKIPNPDYKADFSDRLKKAELKRKKALINRVITNDSWQSAAWYLERQFNEEFGEKKKIEVTDPQERIKNIMQMIKDSKQEKPDEHLPTDSPSVLQGQDGESIPSDPGTE